MYVRGVDCSGRIKLDEGVPLIETGTMNALSKGRFFIQSRRRHQHETDTVLKISA